MRWEGNIERRWMLELLDTLMLSEEFETSSYWMALRALAKDKPEYTEECFKCVKAFEDTLDEPRAETIKRFRVHLRLAIQSLCPGINKTRLQKYLYSTSCVTYI